MSDKDDIPTLTDLIEAGGGNAEDEIRLADLGLDSAVSAHGDMEIDIDDSEPAIYDALTEHPELEQAVRRILEEHMESAWQEIRVAIRRILDES